MAGLFLKKSTSPVSTEVRHLLLRQIWDSVLDVFNVGSHFRKLIITALELCDIIVQFQGNYTILSTPCNEWQLANRARDMVEEVGNVHLVLIQAKQSALKIQYEKFSLSTLYIEPSPHFHSIICQILVLRTAREPDVWLASSVLFFK